MLSTGVRWGSPNAHSVVRIDARIGTMENYMAGFHNNLNWHGSALDELRGRVEVLENPETD